MGLKWGIFQSVGLEKPREKVRKRRGYFGSHGCAVDLQCEDGGYHLGTVILYRGGHYIWGAGEGHHFLSSALNWGGSFKKCAIEGRATIF